MAVTNIIKTKLWLKVLLNKSLKIALNVHILFTSWTFGFTDIGLWVLVMEYSDELMLCVNCK